MFVQIISLYYDYNEEQVCLPNEISKCCETVKSCSAKRPKLMFWMIKVDGTSF